VDVSQPQWFAHKGQAPGREARFFIPFGLKKKQQSEFEASM
jgi:hypothetical protein